MGDFPRTAFGARRVHGCMLRDGGEVSQEIEVFVRKSQGKAPIPSTLNLHKLLKYTWERVTIYSGTVRRRTYSRPFASRRKQLRRTRLGEISPGKSHVAHFPPVKNRTYHSDDADRINKITIYIRDLKDAILMRT